MTSMGGMKKIAVRSQYGKMSMWCMAALFLNQMKFINFVRYVRNINTELSNPDWWDGKLMFAFVRPFWTSARDKFGSLT